MNRRLLLRRVTFLGVAAAVAARAGAEFAVLTSSLLGGSGGEDAVRGLRFQPDGSLVVAANLSPDTPLKLPRGSDRAVILKLSPGGRAVTAALRIDGEVQDMAVDGSGAVYVAAGAGGVCKLDAALRKVVWKDRPGFCRRVDAASDGSTAVLSDSGLRVYDPAGKKLGEFQGRHLTQDVCIDGTRKQVVFCGFRNAHASDGRRTEPVQICYLRAVSYEGALRWSDYDWSTDGGSPEFLNRPENNMADTRGYRCAMGADGRLYAAFEAAGGNHLFRYSPKDVTRRVAGVGGDAYHQFYNSASEHKTVFGRFDPETGEALQIQQFCGRLSNGKANAVRVQDGDIAADTAGRVYLSGTAAYGLPLSFDPEGQGDYTGGAFVLAMSPDMGRRLLCTRLAAGKGVAPALAARDSALGGIVAWGGGGVPKTCYAREPLQSEAPGGETTLHGFFAVAAEAPGAWVAAPSAAGNGVGPSAAASPPARPARRSSPARMARADEALTAKLAALASAGTLRPVPMALSVSTRPLTLAGARADGGVTLRSDDGVSRKDADFRLSDLPAGDRAALAVLVTKVEPDNRAAAALAGFYLECAGRTEAAERLYETAGEQATAMVAPLFDPAP